jgi:hypothetical protein
VVAAMSSALISGVAASVPPQADKASIAKIEMVMRIFCFMGISNPHFYHEMTTCRFDR